MYSTPASNQPFSLHNIGHTLHILSRFALWLQWVLCSVTVDPNIRHGVQVVGRPQPAIARGVHLHMHACKFACAPVSSPALIQMDLAGPALQPARSPSYCTALLGWQANMQAPAHAPANMHVQCAHAFSQEHMHPSPANVLCICICKCSWSAGSWPGSMARDNLIIGLCNRSRDKYTTYAQMEGEEWGSVTSFSRVEKS